VFSLDCDAGHRDDTGERTLRTRLTTCGTVLRAVCLVACVAGPVIGFADSAASAAPDPTTSSLTQTLTATVVGDPVGLTISDGSDQPGVVVSPIQLSGYRKTSTGGLNPITLIDARGTLVGWSLVAQFEQDTFTGPTRVPASSVSLGSGTMTASPEVTCAFPSEPSCLISEVTQPRANVALAGPSGSAVSLGSASPGGGGGLFTVSSGLQLPAQNGSASGTYTDTLVLTVS
jgi:hypothetical protein